MKKTNYTSRCLVYQSRVKTKLCLSLFILPTLLAGCLIVPIPTSVEPLPFDDEKLSPIVSGETDRKQVVALLGEPFTERLNASLALYGSAQRVGGMYSRDPTGKELLEEIEAKHLLLVRYDAHGVVQDFDVFRSKPNRSNSEKCTADGVCIRPRFASITDPSDSWDLGDSRLVAAYFYDTPENDAAAKSITVPPGQCAIFVYFDENVSGDADVLVTQVGDPNPEIRLDGAGYLLWLRDPGLHQIHASAQFETAAGWTSVRKNDFASSTLSLDCMAGQASYVHVDLDETWTKLSMSLYLDDMDTGSGALKDRRLMLGH